MYTYIATEKNAFAYSTLVLLTVRPTDVVEVHEAPGSRVEGRGSRVREAEFGRQPCALRLQPCARVVGGGIGMTEKVSGCRKSFESLS